MADPETWDWDEIRKNRYAPVAPPPDWPSFLRPLSMAGLDLFALDPRTNDLYWDGQKVETTKRLATYERVLATIVTAATVIAAAIEVARFFGGH